MSLDIDLKQNLKCPNCGHVLGEGETVYDANITHNLNKMADEAGIYGIIWRPEENGIDRAGQICAPLARAIEDMKARPEHYKQFDADNGWGTYKAFVPWLEKLLEACRNYPDAEVRCSR